MRYPRALLLAVSLLCAIPIFSAHDVYLKIEGVVGESRAPGHEQWIELSSAHFAGNSCTRDTQRGALKRVALTTATRSEQLNRACASGAPLGTVTLDVNGRRHVLETARFAECPTAPAGSNPPSLQLEYTSCSTHARPSASAR